MVTRIQKWGNSQGLRIARQVLDNANLAVGDDVDVSAQDGVIVVTPIRRTRGGRSLKDLLAKIPKNYRPEEMEWSGPAGKETW